MEFKIGDRVRVKNWEEIDDTRKIASPIGGNPHFWSRGKAKNCGLVGNIVDKLYSQAFNCYTYSILFDGQTYPSRSKFDEESIVLLHDEKEWHYDIESDGTKVTAILYETDAHGVSKEVARGKGFIYDKGVAGYVQAASYALKKIYDMYRGDF